MLDVLGTTIGKNNFVITYLDLNPCHQHSCGLFVTIDAQLKRLILKQIMRDELTKVPTG